IRTSAHGPVRPVWLQGSRVTYAVAPAARAPAPCSATTSACLPPAGSVAPRPRIVPAESTITQPTGGLGNVLPAACQPISSASKNSAGRSAGTSARDELVPCFAGWGPRWGLLGTSVGLRGRADLADRLVAVLLAKDRGTRDIDIDPGRSGLRSGLGPKDRKSTRLNSSHVSISYAVF